MTEYKAMTENERDRLNRAALDAIDEACEARRRFACFNSPHEGISVIREEFEELWDEVKKKEHEPAAMRKEATHLAAMALRFIVDLT